MNKALLKAAAIFNIAAASLIYVSCSGDDGARGEPGAAGQAGASCVGTPSASVPGGIDITCGGLPVGTLEPGKAGQDGQGVPATGCYLTAQAGGYNVVCGGVDQGPLVTTGPGNPPGGGSCEVSDGDAYYILTCGGTPMQIAKAWCAGVPYNPSKSACSTDGTISENRCGNRPIDLDREFCYQDADGKSSNIPLCGVWTVKLGAVIVSPATSYKLDDYTVTNGKEYDPATEFCAKNIYLPTAQNSASAAANDTVYARCGTDPTLAVTPSPTAPNALINHAGGIGSYNPVSGFCFTSTLGAKIARPRCDAANKSDPNTVSNGLSYQPEEMCDGYTTPNTGTVKGSCDGVAYTAADKFCYQALKLYDKCDTSSVASAQKVAFNPATEFCSPGLPKEKVLPLCGDANVTTPARRQYNSIFEFCQGTGTINVGAKILTRCEVDLVAAASASTWNSSSENYVDIATATTTAFNTAWTAATDKEAPTIISFTLVTTAAPSATTDYKLGSTTAGKAYQATEFCGEYTKSGSAVQRVLGRCGGTLVKITDGSTITAPNATDNGIDQISGGYQGTSHYCEGSTATPLEVCATGTKYNPYLQYCDTRDITVSGADVPANKLYEIVKIGNYTWFAENLAYQGIDDAPVGKQYGRDAYGTSPDNVPASSPTKAQYSAAYGRLYSFSEASTACPSEWRLPGSEEWASLVAAAGGPGNASKLKSGTAVAIISNFPGNWATPGTDDLGFKGLPSGRGVYSPEFEIPSGGVGANLFDSEDIFFTNARSQAYWWSGDGNTATTAKFRNLSYDSIELTEGDASSLTNFYSVRCVK